MSLIVSNANSAIVEQVAVASTSLSVAASIIILLLIVKLRTGNNNGHLLLLFLMSITQLLYDLSFVGYLLQSTNKDFLMATDFFQLFGGISTALFTNCITTILFLCISSRNSVNIYKNLTLILVCVLVPALGMGIADVTMATSENYKSSISVYLSPLYYWIRLSSILLNTLLYFATSHLVTRITDSRRLARSPAEIALIALSSRMKFYSIVQTISRSGAAYYEAVYGYSGYTGQGSNSQFVAAIFFALLNPTASIGYLFVFLLMQPRAYITLESYGCYCCTFLTSWFNPDREGLRNVQMRRGSSLHSRLSKFTQDEFTINELEDDALFEIIERNSISHVNEKSIAVSLRGANGSSVSSALSSDKKYDADETIVTYNPTGQFNENFSN